MMSLRPQSIKRGLQPVFEQQQCPIFTEAIFHDWQRGLQKKLLVSHVLMLCRDSAAQNKAHRKTRSRAVHAEEGLVLKDPDLNCCLYL